MKISINDLRLMVKKAIKLNESPLIANMSLASSISKRLSKLKRGIETGEFLESELLEVVDEMNSALIEAGETSTPDFLCPVESSQNLTRDLATLSYETLRQLDEISSTVDVWFQ